MTTTPTTHEKPTLSPAELSRLVDLVTARIEWHEREVKRLEGIKKRIKRKNKGNRKWQESLTRPNVKPYSSWPGASAKGVVMT